MTYAPQRSKENLTVITTETLARLCPLAALKLRLYEEGWSRLKAWCALNRVFMPPTQAQPVPSVADLVETGRVFCGLYRSGRGILVIPGLCSRPATEGQVRNWNWPGSVTDRTPYGVVAHEAGHWWEDVRGWGYARRVKKESGEPPITSYAPNASEWFAEMFRVFVTNPALLRYLRPRTYALLCRHAEPLPGLLWTNALAPNVPPRVLASLRRKVGYQEGRP